MIGKLKEIMRTPGGDWVVSFITRADPRPIFDEFTDKPVNVEIKKASKEKTKAMNDFLWAMCTDIGKALRPPIPKNEVYRMAIKDVGKFDTLHMIPEAIGEFRARWERGGTGWITEVVDYSPIPGYKCVFAYYGISMYDRDELSILIDYLKQDMENMGLPIPFSKEEEERMLTAWQKALCRRTEHATSAGG